MFGKGWRKSRVVAGLFIVASLTIPGVAQAAPPSIVDLTAFGNLRPGDPPQATDPALAPNMGSDTIFANSRPYGYRFEHGLLFVEGKASGDVDGDGKLRLFVDLEVSAPDGESVTKTVTVAPVTDPEIDRVQGEFNAEFFVTELGSHTATGTDPSSVDPADWGATELTVEAVARTVGGTVGAPATTAITKYAGTPKDTFAPRLRNISWPPENWCHLSSKGMEDPIFGLHFGGESDGNCGDFAPFIPFDPTWAGCVEWLEPFVNLRELTTDPFFGSGEHLYGQGCRSARSDDEYVPSGWARVFGTADDLEAPNSFGTASEIADILIEVFQGTTKLREFHNVFRPDGPMGQWSLPMNINDFASTSFGFFDFADPYTIKVTACDAWNNCSNVTSPEIRVYSY